MTNKFIKLISILLCAVLLLNTLPVGVLAQDAGMEQPPVVQPPVEQPPVEQPPVEPTPCTHTGGIATCTVLAVCAACGESYGALASHSGGTATCTDAPVCAACGASYGSALGHSGGTATCTAQAVCAVCGESYGALASHSGGTATCTDAPVCAACGTSYGSALGHSGGTATCTAQAVCDVCQTPYGELSAEHSYGEDGKCLCGAEKPVAPPAPACTCESTDPGEHAPFCALYVRTGEPCLCRVSCAEEGVNEWCETCYFAGAENCAANGEEMPVPYDCTDTYTMPDYFFQIQVTCSRPGIFSIEIDEQNVNITYATSGSGRTMKVPVYLSNGSSPTVIVPMPDFSGYDYCDYSHTYKVVAEDGIKVTVTRAAGVHLGSSSEGKTVVQEANCQHGKRTATEDVCLLCGDGFEKYEYAPDSQPLPHEFVSISMDEESGARIFCYGCREKFPVTLKDAAFTYNGASHCEQENVLGDFLQVDMSAAENKEYSLYESPSVAGDTTNVTDAGFTVNVLGFSKTYSIAPASLTISGIAVKNRLYGETGRLELDLTNAQLQGVFGSDKVQLDGSGAAAAFAGSGTPAPGIAEVTVSGLKLTGKDAANYRLEMPVNLTVKILPTVTEPPTGAAELVYTGEAQQLLKTSGAACEGAEMIYSFDAVQWSADLPTGTDAKEYTVHYGARAGGVSNTGLGSFTVTIAPASLNGAVVTADSCTYDGTEQEPAVVTAVLNGKTLVKDQDFTVTGYSDNVDAGTATVTIQGTGNYTGTASGTFTIHKKEIEIQADSTTISKEYDGRSDSALELTSDEIVTGDAVTMAYQRAYYVDSAGNETADVTTAVSIRVEACSLTGDDSLNYGIKSSDPLMISGASITPKPITVTGLGVEDKIYDGTTAAVVTGTPVASGFVTGHSVDTSAMTAAFADANAGVNKAVTLGSIKVVDGNGNDVTANYSITAGTNITATIQPREITVTDITAVDRVYDGTTAVELDATYAVLTGLLESDGRIVVDVKNGASAVMADKNVGEAKAVTVTGVTLSGQGAGNYILKQPEGITVNITRKEVNITGLKAVNRAYDGTVKVRLDTSAAVVEGKVEGDAVGVYAFTEPQYLSFMADANVGEGKKVTVSGVSLRGVDAINYMMMSPADLTVTITPADLTVSGLAVANKVYDGKTDATVTGTPAVNAGALPVEGLAVNLGTVTASFDDADVGVNKPVLLTGITVEDAQGNDLTGNFRILAAVRGIITPAPITVTPAELEKVYGDTDPAAFTFTTSDKPADGEAIGTLELTRAAGENAGTYAFRLDTKDASTNYLFTLAAGKTGFTIKPYALTAANATVTATDKIYTGKIITGLDKVELNSAVREQTVLVSGTDFTATGATGLNLGTYTVEITGKGNFSGELTATWTINPPAIITSLNSIDMSTVTADQYEELKLLAQALNNADEATMAANGWADEKAKANALVAAASEELQAAAAAVNSPAIRATEETTSYNVTLAQKQTLLSAKGEIEAIQNNTGINSKLSADQKTKLQAQLNNINAALATLAAVENNATYKAAKKWLTDNAGKFDADQLTLRYEYQAVLQQINALDENTKRIVMADLGEALKTAEAALYTYKIIAGNGTAWRRGSYSGLTIKANGHVSLFAYLEVDGRPVNAAMYTLTSGSTIITLKSAYLNTLTYGWHSVQFHYTDGSTQEGYFFVGAYATNAATGDTFNPALWAGLMGLALVGLAALVILNKRSNKKNKK